MDFVNPTTKEQMYQTLIDIFNHYRTINGVFERQPINPLVLTRMEYNPPTDEELTARAEKMVASSNKREILKRKDQLVAKIEMLDTKITNAEKSSQSEIEEVEKLYSESARKVELQSMKNGLVGSGIVVDKLTALEDSKNQRIAKINADKNNLISEYESEKTYLTTQLETCENYYAEIHEDDVKKAFEELKEEREKTIRQVFEYNNALDEKEQRYENQTIKHIISTELRYLEVSSLTFNKNQLIEMGYYEDVINCVMSYYNTLDPFDAYTEVVGDTKIKVYLEDYYTQVLAAYASLAGVS